MATDTGQTAPIPPRPVPTDTERSGIGSAPVGCQDYSRRAIWLKTGNGGSEPPVVGSHTAGRVDRVRDRDLRSVGTQRVRGGGSRRSGARGDPDAGGERHDGDRPAEDRNHLFVPFYVILRLFTVRTAVID